MSGHSGRDAARSPCPHGAIGRIAKCTPSSCAQPRWPAAKKLNLSVRGPRPGTRLDAWASKRRLQVVLTNVRCRLCGTTFDLRGRCRAGCRDTASADDGAARHIAHDPGRTCPSRWPRARRPRRLVRSGGGTTRRTAPTSGVGRGATTLRGVSVSGSRRMPPPSRTVGRTSIMPEGYRQRPLLIEPIRRAVSNGRLLSDMQLDGCMSAESALHSCNQRLHMNELR
jgi:hypothetical protein